MDKLIRAWRIHYNQRNLIIPIWLRYTNRQLVLTRPKKKVPTLQLSPDICRQAQVHKQTKHINVFRIRENLYSSIVRSVSQCLLTNLLASTWVLNCHCATWTAAACWKIFSIAIYIRICLQKSADDDWFSPHSHISSWQISTHFSKNLLERHFRLLALEYFLPPNVLVFQSSLFQSHHFHKFLDWALPPYSRSSWEFSATNIFSSVIASLRKMDKPFHTF